GWSQGAGGHEEFALSDRHGARLQRRADAIGLRFSKPQCQAILRLRSIMHGLGEGSINENWDRDGSRPDSTRVQVRLYHRYRGRYRTAGPERRYRAAHFRQERRTRVHAQMAAQGLPALGEAGESRSRAKVGDGALSAD